MKGTDGLATKRATERRAAEAKPSFRLGSVVSLTDSSHAQVDLGGSRLVPVYLPASLASSVQVGHMVRVSVQRSSYVLDSVMSSSGALVTSGSGSNGDWTKWGDGTMICRHSFTVNPTANTPTDKTWTFPATFIAAPDVLVTAQTTVPGSVLIEATYSDRSTTSCKVWVYRTNGTDTVTSMLAIGRWRT